MPPVPSHPRGAERAALTQAAHGSAFVESKVMNLMIQQEPSVNYVPFKNTTNKTGSGPKDGQAEPQQEKHHLIRQRLQEN